MSARERDADVAGRQTGGRPPPAAPAGEARPERELVTLRIDGKDVTVPKGTLIIRAAEHLGIEIPRFCDHPYLAPVGACRQCYVEVEGQRKLLTSCTTPVAPGMIVRSQYTSEPAHKAQVANLEFLLLNHPLDCPICDRGGECPLQDQALAFGPGESRYREAKRTFEKPIALSPLVALDRERCVLCARCTRFCDEISGDRFIELFARGAGERVAIAAGEDFRSPFSGNTIQICPVGALTAIPYRFAARPFDLKSADTVCPHCASGCSIRLDMRRGAVVRHLARENPEVNDAWLCDKGRFAFRFPDDPRRLTTPLLRERGLEPVSFGEAFATIASWADGARVAFLAGGRLANEDAYALSKLARTVFGTNDLDHRRGEANAGDVDRFTATPGPWHVTYRDVEEAKVILVVGLDAEQEVPILHLRIRKAARRGAQVFVVHPRRTRLWDVAEHLLCRPGEEAALLRRMADGGDDEDAAGRIAAALRAAGEDAVVIAGPRLADRPPGAAPAAALAMRLGAGFAAVSRRANDHGVLLAGVTPGLLPGGRSVDVDADRADVEDVWGAPIPRQPGRATADILRAAANHELDVLFLIGVDPIRDHPDAALARRALENVRYKVVQGLELGSLEPYADAFLPAAAYLEKDAHYTTWEGRSQRLRPVRGAAGLSQDDWEIFAGLAQAMGGDLGFGTVEELRAELAELLAPRDVDAFSFPVVTMPTMDQGVEGARAAPGVEGADGGGGEAGRLTLFTYPLLVDEGRLVEGAAELKAALEEEAFVEIHPDDARALGLSDGAEATIATDAGAATLAVRVSENIAAGAAFVPFNQPGFAANALLSGTFTAPAMLSPAPREGEGAGERAVPAAEAAGIGGG
jgi:NADH-quinone oxidoreductase subunit G